MRVLLVEDEPRAAAILAKGLREHAYAVDIAADGEAAIFQAPSTDYDALILDVMLPLADGLAVCRAMRESGNPVPILMVTARDAVDARIEGLDSGADDYLVKPFDFGELLARLRAIIRRGRQRPLAERIVIGSLVLDTRGRRALVGARELALTAKEYALLEYLVRRAGPAGRGGRKRTGNRGARVGRALRSAAQRRRRLHPAAAAQDRGGRRGAADPHAPRRRLPGGRMIGGLIGSLSLRARLTLWYS